jgi:hypothetical protein
MSSRRTFIQSAIGAATVLGGASRLLGMNRKRASDRPNDSTPLPVNTPDVQAPIFHNRQWSQGIPTHSRTGEAKNRALEDDRLLGLQRLMPGPRNPGEPGRSCTPDSGKSSAGIDRNPLAWPGNPLRHGWNAIPLPEANRAWIKVRIRIHSSSERHILLSLAFAHAADDGNGRFVYSSSPTSAYSCGRSRFCSRAARVGRAAE